jgi:hypothetical protein
MVDASDRRASERMLVGQGTVCTFAGPVKTEVISAARLKDISLEGVGLILTNKVEVGSVLAIVLENEAKGFKGAMLVQVAHVTPAQGGYLVGGTFLIPLSYKDLTTLVL